MAEQVSDSLTAQADQLVSSLSNIATTKKEKTTVSSMHHLLFSKHESNSETASNPCNLSFERYNESTPYPPGGLLCFVQSP